MILWKTILCVEKPMKLSDKHKVKRDVTSDSTYVEILSFILGNHNWRASHYYDLRKIYSEGFILQFLVIFKK
jgi:hypothetical protein